MERIEERKKTKGIKRIRCKKTRDKDEGIDPKKEGVCERKKRDIVK